MNTAKRVMPNRDNSKHLTWADKATLGTTLKEMNSINLVFRLGETQYN